MTEVSLHRNHKKHASSSASGHAVLSSYRAEQSERGQSTSAGTVPSEMHSEEHKHSTSPKKRADVRVPTDVEGLAVIQASVLEKGKGSESSQASEGHVGEDELVDQEMLPSEAVGPSRTAEDVFSPTSVINEEAVNISTSTNEGGLTTGSVDKGPVAAKPNGLASLVCNGVHQSCGASIISSAKVGSTLEDLLGANKHGSNGVTSLSQPTGLAALAMAQPAQTRKFSPSPLAGDSAEPETPPGSETPMQADADISKAATSKNKLRKGRPPGSGKQKKAAAKPASRVKEEKAKDEPAKKPNKRKQITEPNLRTSPSGDDVAGGQSPERPKRRGRPPASPAKSAAAKRGKGQGRGGKTKSRVIREETPLTEPEFSCESESEGEEEKFDVLYGCSGCHWHPHGCIKCRDRAPILQRSQNVRWKPEEGRMQEDIPEAPTFYPTEEEFADPLSYINKVRVEGEKAGIACIVPPKGWAPPFALDKGTNGQSADSFRFSIRRQPTWQLCMRAPNAKQSGRKSAAGRYDAKKPDEGDTMDLSSQDEDGEFGFVTLDRTHTLSSFAAYANWVKCLHFGIRNMQIEGSSKRRRTSEKSSEPSVQDIEAEFWRIVETPDEVVESLYGQDLDSGHHGSGFPLPPFRKRLLEEHLRQKAKAARKEAGHPEECSCQSCKCDCQVHYTPEEEAYSQHCWNINNLPRCKGSVLRYVIGDELITGVMVPWLYVGSCLSAFCWHIEDHALYSINYLHNGAPKVWYGVPAHASDALDEAMRDALPHLFEAAPDLLYQLVTMLSPSQLQERGVPVHRLVHQKGSFVITFPNAYHAGFNTGFNCAEAVNFAPPDWLPWGCSILGKYRRDGKAATLSNDALLIALVKGAKAVQGAGARAQQEEDSPTLVRATLVASEEGGVTLDLQVMEHPSVDFRAESGNSASTSGRAAVPGQRADTSYLDPIKVEDAPKEAIRLAAAELAVRVQEERRRRAVGLKAHTPQQRLMAGKPGEKDERGLHRDTEDTDCMQCKCDLWLSAVISPACPGLCFCPEHAHKLPCKPQEWLLLFRYQLEELDELLATAEECIEGTTAAIAAAIDRKNNPPKVTIKKLGPITDQLPTPPTFSPSPSEGKPTRQPPAAAKSSSQEAKQVALKVEEPLEDPYESAADLSDSPLPEPKMKPKKRKEEGDWMPPKKRGRGPGKKKVATEKDNEMEVAATKVVKAEASVEAQKPPVERASSGTRSRGRGRGRGRARTRGAGKVAENKAQEPQPSAAAAVPPVPATASVAAVPPMASQPQATWDQQQAAGGGAPAWQHAGFLNSVAQLPPRPAAASGGNSVLMEILKASVQSQPQGGHIAPGSVPLSQAAMSVPAVSSEMEVKP